MFNFILKKILYGFLVLIGVVTVVFLLFNVLPGDPARMMLGQRADQTSIDAINIELGRDKSLGFQYFMYVNDLSPISLHDTKNEESHIFLDTYKYDNTTKLFGVGNNKILVLKPPYLRRSYQSKKKVSEIIGETLPGTAVLAIVSMVFATFLGIILGVFSALKKGSFWDGGTLVASVLGMSAPSFFAGIIFAWVFAYLLGDLTGLNMTGSLYKYDLYQGKEVIVWKNLILPAFTLGIRPLAIIMQLTRSSLLDVLSQDYIRTARAKGLNFYSVVFKHALINALNPVVTAISGWFASLMAGAVLVEYIFGWKGIGKEIVEALEKYDFPLVMGSVLVVAIVFIVVNILVDIAYGFLDPRVRLE